MTMQHNIQDNFRRIRADFVQNYLSLGTHTKKINEELSLTLKDVEQLSDRDAKNKAIWNSLITFYKSTTNLQGNFDCSSSYLEVIEQLRNLEEGRDLSASQLQKSLDKLIKTINENNYYSSNSHQGSAEFIHIDAKKIINSQPLQLAISTAEDDGFSALLTTEMVKIIEPFTSLLSELGLTRLHSYFLSQFDNNNNPESNFASLLGLYDLYQLLKSGPTIDTSLSFEELYPQIYSYFANKELAKAIIEFNANINQFDNYLERESSQLFLKNITSLLLTEVITNLPNNFIEEIQKLPIHDKDNVSHFLNRVLPYVDTASQLLSSTEFALKEANTEEELTPSLAPNITEIASTQHHPYYLSGKMAVTLRDMPDYDDELAAELRESYVQELENDVFPIVEISLQKLSNPPYDNHSILELRRAFHTMKGSGYMATYMYEGEIGWRVEEVLNGCRDGKFTFTPAIWYHANDGYQAIKKRLQNEYIPEDELERIAFQGDYLIKHLGVVDPSDLEQLDVNATKPISAPESVTSQPKFDDEEIIADIKKHLHQTVDSEQKIEPTASTDDINAEETFHDGSVASIEANRTHLQNAISHLIKELNAYKMGNFGALKRLTHVLHNEVKDSKLIVQNARLEPLVKALFTNILYFRAHGLSPQEENIQSWENVITEINNVLYKEPNYQKFASYLTALNAPIEQYNVSIHQENKPATDIDDELFDFFVNEAQEILEAVDGLISEWKNQDFPENSAYLDELKRLMHTLKGGARMVNKQDIAQLSHAIESLLDSKYIKQFSSDPRQFDILQRSLDQIPFMLEYPHSALDQEGYNLLSALYLLIGNETPPELDITGNLAGEDIITKVTEKTSFAAQAALSAIRVAPKQITDIYEHLAENIILNNQQKRSIYQMVNTLDELDRTIIRVNSQVRRIEIETEAQMLSRHARIYRDSKDFDPLELDRFSELQQLSRFVMEAVEDLSSLHKNFLEQTDKLNGSLEKQSNIQMSMDSTINQIRTVNFLSIIPRLRRIIRQVSKANDKRVELITIGTDIQVERVLLEQMIAPLEHMIRNSIIHGIEIPEVREKLGKDKDGKITIEVLKKGSDLVINFQDDGQGIDVEVMHQKAIASGVITEEQEFKKEDFINILMLPGTSTAATVTQDAGRGVGLNVLTKAINLLNATFNIINKPNESLTFNIHIPFTLTRMNTLIVKAGMSKYAIPLEGIVTVDQEKSNPNTKNNSEKKAINYQGINYTIYELSKIYGDFSSATPSKHTNFYLLFNDGKNYIALQVNRIITQQEVIMKPLNPQISLIPGFAGSSILPSGEIVYIIDIPSLINSGLLVSEELITQNYDDLSSYLNKELQKQSAPLVMVVDDSITMRKVSTRMLERHGLLHSIAKDGLDALEKIEENIPDLIMLDIEMPNMDGFEVLNYIKSHDRFKHIPVIMVTSRTGEKHKDRAFTLGASRYCGKPYQEKEMINIIGELLGDKWVRSN